MYQERTYRRRMAAPDLHYFTVVRDETDLRIAAQEDLQEEAMAALVRARCVVEDYGETHPDFLTSLVPLPHLPGDPPIVKAMKAAAQVAGTGPMAAVAGAVSKAVGEALMELSPEIIVENGGDLFLCSRHPRRIEVEAGASAFSRLRITLPGSAEPLGICTSSGTMGHSLSFGHADAATVISPDVVLADALATALGNGIKTAADLGPAMDWIKKMDKVTGALAIVDNQLGVWGDLKIG